MSISQNQIRAFTHACVSVFILCIAHKLAMLGEKNLLGCGMLWHDDLPTNVTNLVAALCGYLLSPYAIPTLSREKDKEIKKRE